MNIDKTSQTAIRGPTPLTESCVTCAECCALLPPAAASNFEMEDYVLHFCSAQCYQTWQAKAGQSDADGSE